jgi:hypothetical protein
MRICALARQWHSADVPAAVVPLTSHDSPRPDLPIVSRAGVVASRQDGSMYWKERIMLISDALAELAALQAAAAAAVERALSALAGLDEAALQGVRRSDCPQAYRSHRHPVVDPTTYTLEWHGRRCDLGPSILFRLIRRLLIRPNRYFTYDILMQVVWGQPCSNAAVRSAVKRLRQLLRAADMPELAAAIRGRRGCYGLFLHGNGP